jgi:hypothetical protein
MVTNLGVLKSSHHLECGRKAELPSVSRGCPFATRVASPHGHCRSRGRRSNFVERHYPALAVAHPARLARLRTSCISISMRFRGTRNSAGYPLTCFSRGPSLIQIVCGALKDKEAKLAPPPMLTVSETRVGTSSRCYKVFV